MTRTVKATALRIFKEVQDKGERAEEDLVKLTTKVQNHIITNILLGKDKSFEVLSYENEDDTTTDMELGDFIDATVLAFFERFKKNKITMIIPALLKY